MAETKSENKTVLLTVDVEDWFQVENLRPHFPFATWSRHELRVEGNTHRLLDLFDACAAERGAPVRATFFVLGWVAERLPQLVREIVARGHEVASHGYGHVMCHELSAEQLRNDLTFSKQLLEEIAGVAVTGYRAPSFSVGDAVLRVIGECGYRYDSSFNSFALNKRYGQLDLARSRRQQIALHFSEGAVELPISNYRFGSRVLPLGGGGYFRLLPLPLFRAGARQLLERDRAYLFYMHPWEIDPGQPRVTSASALSRFRHYVNLARTEGKLRRLVQAFSGCRFATCGDYLDGLSGLASAGGTDG